MDMSVIQAAWACVQQNYPQFSGAILQVIGGATVLFRLMGSSKLTGGGGTGGWFQHIVGFLGKIALNK